MRLLEHGPYPPDVVEEAREKLRKGDFRRTITARMPRDTFFDDALLSCGHNCSAFQLLHEATSNCHDCADDWMRDETEKRKV